MPARKKIYEVFVLAQVVSITYVNKQLRSKLLIARHLMRFFPYCIRGRP